MNILIIASVSFPNGMASTAFVKLLAKGLIQNGNNVTLLIESNNFNLVGNKINKNQGSFDGINYKYFNRYSVNNKKKFVNRLRNVKDLAGYIKKRKKAHQRDVILCIDNRFWTNFQVYQACNSLNIPIFQWFLEKEISRKSNNWYKSLSRFLGYKLTDMIVPRVANGIIVITTYLKDYHSQRLAQDKIHISPIYIDPQEFPTTPSLSNKNTIFKTINEIRNNKDKIIVYSGSFQVSDGFSYIFYAFKRLLKKYPKTILVTTGRNPKMEDIFMTEAKRFDFFKNIVSLGFLSKEEMIYVQKNADLLLGCRVNTEIARHGFPWKLGDYLMTKKPIIATKVGNIERYLINQKEIILAEPENSDSIYYKMKYVFDNYDDALRIAEKGYFRALKEFNYINRTKEVSDFIKSNI